MISIDIKTMKKMIRDARNKLQEINNDNLRIKLGIKLDLAEKKHDINEIKTIYAEISYICMQNPDKNILENNILYKEPPTFDQAVIDFLNLNIPDMIRLPEQDTFFGYTLASEENITSNNMISKIDRCNSKNTNVEIMVETQIPKRKMLQTIGSTQTQKTNYTIGLAVKSLLKGITPVMITRDYLGDASQFEKRIYDFGRNLEDYLDKNNVVNRKFTLKVDRADKLCDIFNPLSIIVCLGNESQIPKVINMLKNNTTIHSVPKVNIMIDENDKVDYSLGTKTYTALAELKEMSHQTFGITATPLDVLALQEDMKVKDVFILTDPKDYRGHLDIMIKLLEVDPKVCGINKVATFQDIIEHDKNLIPFLDEFSKTTPEYAWSIREHLPNICLIKLTNINITQEALFDGIYQNYEDKFVMILMHEKGIKMKFKGMKDCIINEKIIKPNTFEKNIDLPDWLQYLKNNGGVKKFPRIMFISGYKAERCISFVSRDYVWHLTNMYYNPSKNTSIPTMWQETGRLTGRNKGKSHLHLHCTKRVADSLYHGINFTNEAISRAIKNPMFVDDEEQTLFKSIINTPMLNKKFPKYRNITFKACLKRKNFKLVKKNDGGLDLDSYKYNIIESPEIEIDDEIDEIIVEDDLDSEKLKRVKDAYNKSGSIIHKIINKFMNNNFQPLSKEELNVTNIANYDRWNLGKHAQYKIIEKTKDDLYKLTNEIKNIFKFKTSN